MDEMFIRAQQAGYRRGPNDLHADPFAAHVQLAVEQLKLAATDLKSLPSDPAVHGAATQADEASLARAAIAVRKIADLLRGADCSDDHKVTCLKDVTKAMRDLVKAGSPTWQDSTNRAVILMCRDLKRFVDLLQPKTFGGQLRLPRIKARLEALEAKCRKAVGPAATEGKS
jgi:hypothetical protein